MSRGLTKKTQDINSSDDEAGDNENIADIALSQDPMNPWMLKQSDKSNVNAEFDFGYKKHLKNKMYKRKEDSESDDDDDDEKNITDNKNKTSELAVLKQSIKNLAKKTNEFDSETTNKVDNSPVNEDSSIDLNSFTTVKETQSQKENNREKSLKNNTKKNTTPKTTSQEKTKKLCKPVATSGWIVEEIGINVEEGTKPLMDISSAFESFEDKVAGEVEKKLQKFRKRLEMIEKSSKQKNKKKQNKPDEDTEIDNLEYLKLRNNKQKAIIDEELIETGSKGPDEVAGNDIITNSKILNAAATVNPQESGVSGQSNIDPNRFIIVKPKYLNSGLSKDENEADLLDDDEQVVPRVNIEEVFEEDDVVASFRQEKEEEANKDKPEDIDLSLPGWGSWGGKGVKAPKRKKNRMIFKAAPKMPRRDENKGDVIIKEFRDPKLAVHKVKEIPFPFNSVRDYEASIRAPLGNTFIPGKAHKKLIRPSVITKVGAIIEPMDEEELLVKKNRNFMNEKVLKILGQK